MHVRKMVSLIYENHENVRMAAQLRLQLVIYEIAMSVQGVKDMVATKANLVN